MAYYWLTPPSRPRAPRALRSRCNSRGEQSQDRIVGRLAGIRGDLANTRKSAFHHQTPQFRKICRLRIGHVTFQEGHGHRHDFVSVRHTGLDEPLVPRAASLDNFREDPGLDPPGLFV